MGEGVNCIHHVVWCIEPQSMPGVRALWEEALFDEIFGFRICLQQLASE